MDAQFYLGKVCLSSSLIASFSISSVHSQRVAYVYKAKREIQGSKIRVIWGFALRLFPPRMKLIALLTPSRVTRPHGNSGVVKSKFTSNLPPRAFGAGVRIVRILSLFLTWQAETASTLDALPLQYLKSLLLLREVDGRGHRLCSLPSYQRVQASCSCMHICNLTRSSKTPCIPFVSGLILAS